MIEELKISEGETIQQEELKKLNFVCSNCKNVKSDKMENYVLLKDSACCENPDYKVKILGNHGKEVLVGFSQYLSFKRENVVKIINDVEILDAYEEKKEQQERIVLMNKFSPVPYAEKLMQRNRFIYDKYKRFWRFDFENGVWREDAEEFIKNILRDRLLGEEQQRNIYCSEIVNYLRDLSYKPDFEGQLDENLIPFKNCLFNLEKEEFIEFSPNYFVTNKLPVEIDSKYIECPIIDSFFEDSVGKEWKILLYEAISYCLYRGQPNQKLLFIFGKGKNGKSVFVNLLTAFLGKDNISSISPHQLCNDNFALGSMWNKYANISSDISYEILKNVSRLKEIVGGDHINIRRLYKEGFPAKIYSKQIFVTNQLPIVNDKTHAWFRRLHLIEFPNEPPTPDPMLINKLITKEELNGLAWQCVKYLKGMKKNNFEFSYGIDEEKLIELYEDLSNPLNKFLREYTIENSSGAIYKYEFKERFVEWLKENKLREWNQTEIGLQMKQKYEDGRKLAREPTYNNETGEFVNKQYWTWLGLIWNSHGRQISQPFITSSLYIRASSKSMSTLSSVTSTKTDKSFIDNLKTSNLSNYSNNPLSGEGRSSTGRPIHDFSTGNEGKKPLSKNLKNGLYTACNFPKTPMYIFNHNQSFVQS